MLSKALLVIKSKAALAVLGLVLVAGGGTALTVMATSGHAPVANGPQATKTAEAGKSASSHAHTVSLEGVLKGYDASAGTIGVVEHGDTSTTTIDVNSKTEVNGAHASTLSDLAKAIGHKVQVQATKQSGGALLAWKITVEAATGSRDPAQQTELQGTVASVGTTSFVLTLQGGGTTTVTVSAETHFAGSARKLADLKKGDVVSVHGTTQSDGTVAATSVEDR